MKIRSQQITSLLNKIAAEYAKDANLSETEIRNAAISCLVLTLHRSGVSIKSAFDAVMGEGATDRLAGDVYDAIRAAA